ncbi:MAG: hypothetical protein M3355_12090 [Actinomycetota bacterium]|nr:hypothetical protein [Actinomycetota bacterium]
MSATPPLTKTKLIELLKAAPTLANVYIARHLPGVLPQEKERIYIVGTRELRRDGGRGPRNETYDLELLCEVANVGGTATQAEDRCWELFDAIDGIVDANEELKGTVWEAEVAAANENTGPTDSGWISKVDLRISIRAVGGG